MPFESTARSSFIEEKRSPVASGRINLSVMNNFSGVLVFRWGLPIYNISGFGRMTLQGRSFGAYARDFLSRTSIGVALHFASARLFVLWKDMPCRLASQTGLKLRKALELSNLIQ